MSDDVEIRPLRSPADYAACVALQRETWGADFSEVVPPAILQVAQHVGGVAAGAFARDGRLLGFVFGLTGVEGGRVVHWSDMLAVRPELRDQGLGRRLKAWQRDAARDAGAEVMYWTFDPLVARNAHLNVNRLGARPHHYVEDMYGESDSVLHQGLGTDRLILAWPLVAAPPDSRCPDGDLAALPPVLRHAPLVHDHDASPDDDRPDALVVAERPAAVRIAVPLDVHARLAADPADARRWRRETRHAWQWALGAGYALTGFCRDRAAGLGWYLLERTPVDLSSE